MHVKEILSAGFKNHELIFKGQFQLWHNQKSEQDKTALQEQQQRELEFILPQNLLNSFNPTLQSVGKRIL